MECVLFGLSITSNAGKAYQDGKAPLESPAGLLRVAAFLMELIIIGCVALIKRCKNKKKQCVMLVNCALLSFHNLSDDLYNYIYRL